ncbi:hypothetical protein C5167_013116 [Papaver somniferum]|uniref:Glycosyltransferase 2-like domain-containing protein n=1 Tax=Papaver somniferum TaxID=3469 RepID=A0A4Y7J2I9_PAPSO|nr:hypothetical protein C5167_013116 [Papaver somniferum]
MVSSIEFKDRVKNIGTSLVKQVANATNNVAGDEEDDPQNNIPGVLVKLECKRWQSKGINIIYEIRDNRLGYKSGVLKEGMKRSYVMHCDYVAIFDADFQPEPDYLWRTIPFLYHNPEIALVQARWTFAQADTKIRSQADIELDKKQMDLGNPITAGGEDYRRLYA